MQLPEIRDEHERFIADLARYTNEGAIQKVMKRTDQEMKYLYNMALTGLQLISKWTNSILELYVIRRISKISQVVFHLKILLETSSSC